MIGVNSVMSRIMVANSAYQKDWLTNAPSVYSVFSQLQNTNIGTFALRNPSIAGYPKTTLLNSIDYFSDHDYGIVDMLAWRQFDENWNFVNDLICTGYSEVPGSTGIPSTPTSVGAPYFSQNNFGWDASLLWAKGLNSQASFSTFTDDYNPTFKVANGISSDLFTYSIGSWKLGTFDSVLPFKFYRYERRAKDTAAVSFTFGDVRTVSPRGDTAQVRLTFGVDTAGFATKDEVRDSIFRTEPFELATGESISYYRGAIYASWDSMTNVILSDTTLSMNYVVELVHIDGAIDTMERIAFSLGHGNLLEPKVAHTLPSMRPLDTVYVRVRGIVSGFSNDDSLCQFACETSVNGYTASLDTLVALKQSGAFRTQVDGSLLTTPIFPNPLVSNSRLSTIVSAPKGLLMRIDVVDQTGNVLQALPEEESNGSWKRVSFVAPSAPGVYFLHIVAGADSRAIPFAIMK